MAVSSNDNFIELVKVLLHDNGWGMAVNTRLTSELSAVILTIIFYHLSQL